MGIAPPDLRSRRILTASRRVFAQNARIPGTSAAIGASSNERRMFGNPFSTEDAACATTPPTLRSVPSSASSPSITIPEKSFSESPHSSAMIPSAMARSNAGPDFRSSAGARLTVTRLAGKENPEFRIAVRTRSRLSWTAVSPSQTMENDGSPGETSVSTRTICQNNPRIEEEKTVLTMKKARKKNIFALPETSYRKGVVRKGGMARHFLPDSKEYGTLFPIP